MTQKDRSAQWMLENLGIWLRSIPADNALRVGQQPMFRLYRPGWREESRISQKSAVSADIEAGYLALDIIYCISSDTRREHLFRYHCEFSGNLARFAKYYNISDRLAGRWVSSAVGGFEEVYNIYKILRE